MMPDYDGLRKKCEAVIEENLRGKDLLNYTEFSKEYFPALLAEKNLVFYKYFAPPKDTTKDYVLQNLESDTITCNNPRAFNDVFEGMVTSLDGEEAKEVRAIIGEISDNVAISCFSEKWDNLLMYAHYADSFRGFCVEYDFSYILQKYPYYDYGYFFPVLYQSKPSSLARMKELRQDISRHRDAINAGTKSPTEADDIISYFIHKADIWSYEREWRFIIPAPQYEIFFHDNSIDKELHFLKGFDCVSAVFLAPNIDSKDRKKICDIIEKKNQARIAGGRNKITVYQTTISDYAYSLDKKEIL